MTFIVQDQKALYRQCAVMTSVLLKRNYLCMEIKHIRKAGLTLWVLFKKRNKVNSSFSAERLKERPWAAGNVVTKKGHLGDYFSSILCIWVYAGAAEMREKTLTLDWEMLWCENEKLTNSPMLLPVLTSLPPQNGGALERSDFTHIRITAKSFESNWP